eukprot:2162726-Rhodomonas_salina.2
MERALVGERVAGLLGTWWKHSWVQGSGRLRRRLKRNPQGSSHTEHAYDQSGAAVTPPQLAERRGSGTGEGDVTAEGLRSGGLLHSGVKVRERPDRFLDCLLYTSPSPRDRG